MNMAEEARYLRADTHRNQGNCERWGWRWRAYQQFLTSLVGLKIISVVEVRDSDVDADIFMVVEDAKGVQKTLRFYSYNEYRVVAKFVAGEDEE